MLCWTIMLSCFCIITFKRCTTIALRSSTTSTVFSRNNRNFDKFGRKLIVHAEQSSESLETETDIQGIISDEFRNKVKEFRKLKAPKKLYDDVLNMKSSLTLDRSTSVFAFRALQRMNRIDLALELVTSTWIDLAANDTMTPQDIQIVLPMLKSCCREGRMDLACQISAVFNVTPEYSTEIKTGLNPIIVEAKQAFLPELALGFSSSRSFDSCMVVLEHCLQSKMKLSADISKQIFKSFLKGEGNRQIRKALRILAEISTGEGIENDFIQILCSYYLRTLEFMKGSVSIDTLPPELYPEVCFIGRSNVGKSSLINMLTNTKKLAFTSKTPGKTSEFNYFNASGVVGQRKERHGFYLVDVPGVGYAEVNKVLRSSWLDLLRSYVEERKSLRLICHLVDSRHGLLAADEQCFELLRCMPSHVQYVIILTKADKRSGEGRHAIVEQVTRAVKERTGKDIRVILSSSDTREGGPRIWSSMLDAFCGDALVL